MKAPDPPKFPGHGASRFERRGQILLLFSEGPFNAEHIQSLVPQFQSLGAALAQDGPWASVNVVTRSIISTPDAIDMLRKSALWTRDAYHRVAAGYVAGPDVEGRAIMLPILYRCYAEVIPVEVFHALDDGMAWAKAQVEAAMRGR
ncbi:MAG TPA: hypothetical protein PKZ76_00040 [Xanthomonadaceae bacterium]|nr:hypothetical protein [Xanthomonadaceae bacterium]